MSEKKVVKEDVVDGEFTEVKAQEERPVETGLTVTMYADGALDFHVFGADTNLAKLDGLARYLERNMDRLWEEARKKQQQ